MLEYGRNTHNTISWVINVQECASKWLQEDCLWEQLEVTLELLSASLHKLGIQITN